MVDSIVAVASLQALPGATAAATAGVAVVPGGHVGQSLLLLRRSKRSFKLSFYQSLSNGVDNFLLCHWTFPLPDHCNDQWFHPLSI